MSFTGTEQSLNEVAEDRQRIETHFDKRFTIVDQNLAYIKGEFYEQNIKNKATGIFGIFIKRGKDAKGKLSEQLYKAVTDGKISEHEFEQVMVADLLWSGQLHISGLDILLVIEASWCAELNDLERAIARATILRTIDINALPVVAGKLWADKLLDLALERGVVVIEDKRINKDTWKSAILSGV